MGTLVFQANLGGSVNLIGPNTASTVNFTLPSADGTNGQALVTNGSGTLSFSSFVSSAAGSNTQVQFNSGGAFAGSANLTFDGTTLTAAGFSGPLNGSVGATTPSTGAFTTLSASSTITFSGGTANGVLYLNGSKVATTGTGLVFDANGNFGVGIATVPNYNANLRTVSFNNTNGVVHDYCVNGTRTGSIVCQSSGFDITTQTNTPLIFSTNGTEGMRLTSTGLGIGTSNPLTKLVVSNAGAEGLEISPTTGIVRLTAYNRSGGGYTSLSLIGTSGITQTIGSTGIDFNSQMLLNSSGNLGLGVTPSAWGGNISKAFQLGTTVNLANGYNSTYLSNNGYNNSSNQFIYQTTGNTFGMYSIQAGSSVHVWYTAPSGTAGNAITFTQAMTLDASGNLIVGDTSAAARVHIKGADNTSATSAVYVQSTDSTLFRIRNDGRIETGATTLSPYNNTTGSAANLFVDVNGILFRSTSSLKYKTDVKEATHGLAEVLQLRPVTYKGKKDGDTIFGGLIAEEVHAIGLTEFVQYAEDGSPDSLAYGNMVSLLTKAIQEQQAQIESLRKRLADAGIA